MLRPDTCFGTARELLSGSAYDLAQMTAIEIPPQGGVVLYWIPI